MAGCGRKYFMLDGSTGVGPRLASRGGPWVLVILGAGRLGEDGLTCGWDGRMDLVKE